MNKYNINSQKQIDDTKIAVVPDIHLNKAMTKEATGALLGSLQSEMPSYILIPGNLYDVDESTIYSGDMVSEFISRLTEIAPVFYIKGESELHSYSSPRGFFEYPNPDFYRIGDHHIAGADKDFNEDVLSSGQATVAGIRLPQEFYRLDENGKIAYLLSRYSEYLDRLANSCNKDSLNILLCQDPAISKLYDLLDSLKAFDLIVSGPPSMQAFTEAEEAYFSQKENTSIVNSQGCIDMITVRTRG